MGKSKIKMVMHYAEDRDDFFVVFYESGRHATYSRRDLPSSVLRFWQTSLVVKEEWNEAAQRYEYVSFNTETPQPESWIFADVFYTGGGIWLSAAYVDNFVYCVVDSDADDCLTWYDRSEEGNDADSDYPCVNMIASKNVDDLNAGERKIYDFLHDALLREKC